jgi:predicted MFS family arabinose efflux permease
MVLITVGEMITFPFSNAFAYDRAKKGKQGEYMALYAIAFSLSHIFCHKAGMQMIANLGFNNTWYIITIIGVICVFLLLVLDTKLTPKRKTNT